MIRLTKASTASLEGAHKRNLGLVLFFNCNLDIKVKTILQITFVLPVPGGPIIKPKLGSFNEQIVTAILTASFWLLLSIKL